MHLFAYQRGDYPGAINESSSPDTTTVGPSLLPLSIIPVMARSSRWDIADSVNLRDIKREVLNLRKPVSGVCKTVFAMPIISLL